MRPTVPDHKHTCCKCGYTWGCTEFSEADCWRIGTFRSVEVNKDGPHCYMCIYLEMARRIAESRGRRLIVNFVPIVDPDGTWPPPKAKH